MIRNYLINSKYFDKLTQGQVSKIVDYVRLNYFKSGDTVVNKG
jgi:signal-transduction protein with cAMP-binding, CBS, and nucleotidyltransferase domain